MRVTLPRTRPRGRTSQPVHAPQRAADPEAALGEVQAVAHGTADAVVRRPVDEGRVQAAAQDDVLEQPTDLVVGECRDDRAAEVEAAPERPSDVVLRAAVPDVEGTGRADAPVSRVQPQHDLAK